VILIDPPIWSAHGRRWSHLVSDLSLRELHAFATAVGVPERAFEGDHYDVPEDRYAQIVRAGAIPVNGRELLRRLQQSGLRRPKRRGERVVAGRWDHDRDHRVDAVLSALPPLAPVSRVHLVLMHAGHVLVVGDGEGFRLPDVAVIGRPYPQVAHELAAALLDDAWASSPGRQVGYLRRVPPGWTRPVEAEVVLRWSDPAPPPDGPVGLVQLPIPAAAALPGFGELLSWVPVRRAVALLPVELAPLALNEHHRIRPAAGRPPDPFRPAGW